MASRSHRVHRHEAIPTKIDEIGTALKVQGARTTLSKVTPIKGDTFENQVHEVLFAIATGLCDEYTDTPLRRRPEQQPHKHKGHDLFRVRDQSAWSS